MTGLTVIATSNSSIRVNWTDNEESHQDSYHVRFRGVHQSAKWTSLGILTGQETTVAGLTPGKKYTFAVKAVSNNHTSDEMTTSYVMCKYVYNSDSH